MAVTLSAEKRDGNGKGAARRLRASGRVPAVLYGKGTDTVSLSVDAREAEYLFQSISVENTIVGLDIQGEKNPVQTLVREIQVHPYKNLMLHVDFLRIREGVEVELEIPINIVGIPEGVKNSGGVLQTLIYEIPVKCLPSKIPESIDVDVTALEIGDAIHVADLHVPEGVELLVEDERTVCSVSAPRVISEDEEDVEEEELEGMEGEADEGPVVIGEEEDTED